ncbi:MAG: NAD-dependent epimerase/dehydratase family protein [Candidatus Omnitrophota bacterium]
MNNSVVNNKVILVAGGAGYIASNLVNAIKDCSCTILRLDRPGVNFPPVAGKAIIKDIARDIRADNAWAGLLEGVDIIFYLAGQTSVYSANNDPKADLELNVIPLINLLEACRKHNFKPCILFSSTVTISGVTEKIPVNESFPDNPVTIYDLHKSVAENYIKYYIKQGVLSGVILRLANVYGPGPKNSSSDRGILNLMVRKALNSEGLTIYGDGNYLRDYIFVDDVIAAFINGYANMDKCNGRHFVIGSGKGFRIADMVNLVAERARAKTGRGVNVEHIAPPEGLSGIEFRNFVADTTNFKQATGWLPKVCLAQGLDLTIGYYLNADNETGKINAPETDEPEK